MSKMTVYLPKNDEEPLRIFAIATDQKVFVKEQSIGSRDEYNRFLSLFRLIGEVVGWIETEEAATSAQAQGTDDVPATP